MSTLPPEGSVVRLPAGRFRAIVVKPGHGAGTAILRGWFLDREQVSEEYVTVDLGAISVLEEG